MNHDVVIGSGHGIRTWLEGKMSTIDGKPSQGRVIAIAGKGGAGKTLLSALVIRILAKGQKLKLLAIDAD